MVFVSESSYEQLKKGLLSEQRSWCVTGVAGFIGSNILQMLLSLNQKVIGVDNFITGSPDNLQRVSKAVTKSQWELFSFIEGDINQQEICEQAVDNVDYVLHQAALGSVPRSIANPLLTNHHNVNGFLTMLFTAQKSGVKRFVYASSSSVYGDHKSLPKVEDIIGKQLSPYAVSKYANELYAHAFAQVYGIEMVGLRYFNVFGPMQRPQGPYAAVIPKWINKMINGEDIEIYGDGETSRDFCYIDNAVQANLLAATVSNEQAVNRVYNIACGGRTTLNETFKLIKSLLQQHVQDLPDIKAIYRDFRPGDVRHAQADTSNANDFLGYTPTHNIEDGLVKTVPYYLEQVG